MQFSDTPEPNKRQVTRFTREIDLPNPDGSKSPVLVEFEFGPGIPPGELTPAQLEVTNRQYEERRRRERALLKAIDERPLTEAQSLEIERLITVLDKSVDWEIKKAGKYKGGPGDPAWDSVHGEIGGIGGIAQDKAVDWEENPPNPPFHPSTHSQKAVYPKDSILGDYFEFAVTLCEGADCFIIGSILPVCAGLLSRGVWLPWAPNRLFPNLYAMLAGKAGDRKSSTIDLADGVARLALPQNAFLPKDYSPETLFDEYDEEAGGRPDKILLRDDAGVMLADWQKATGGERVASRFLELYDCKGLSENYRRNRPKKGSKETQKRYIPETSTSAILGATFSTCMFRNQAVRSGLQRRFLYYVAEDAGRVIEWPESDYVRLKAISESKFLRLGKLSGLCTLTPSARTVFENYQRTNRATKASADPFDEPLLSRLSSAPVQVLKVAMIFEACRSVKAGSYNLQIQESTISLAIDHVEECLKASTVLEGIAHRIYIKNDAEVLLAKIRVDYRLRAKSGSIILSRSELTGKYANHGRRAGLSVNDIYLKQIPYLIATGQAKALEKTGKLERYAFRVESR